MCLGFSVHTGDTPLGQAREPDDPRGYIHSLYTYTYTLLSHGEEYLSHGKAGVQKRKIFIYVISQAFRAAYISNFVSSQ